MKLKCVVFLGVTLLTTCFSASLLAYSKATCGQQKYVCCSSHSSTTWQNNCTNGSSNASTCSANSGLGTSCVYS